jgi:hypothetical protein
MPAAGCEVKNLRLQNPMKVWHNPRPFLFPKLSLLHLQTALADLKTAQRSVPDLLHRQKNGERILYRLNAN